jgi:histidinol-phosphate aminotransferase
LTEGARSGNVNWEEDMGYALNRRQWLKASTVAITGFVARPSWIYPAKEKTFPRYFSEERQLVRLDSNESPFGISEKAREAIIDAIDLSNRYPHGRYFRLKELIARNEGLSPDHIFLGAGSTEVMVTLIHLIKSKGEILVGDPTYFDFIYYASLADCSFNRIKLNGSFEHDLVTMEKQASARTSLIYICNPLNPTGTISPADELRSFCRKASDKALVVVDEAYHEYVENSSYSSMVDLVKEGKDVIVTRTFSKIFGLAGLRVGYGMARPEIIENLKKMSRNFAPVSWLSLQAAIASYQDRVFMQTIKDKNKLMRQYLCQELKKSGLRWIPSHTNFVLLEVDQDAREMAKKMEDSKILVRPFDFHGRQWIRVSIGNRSQIQAFLSVLSDFI